MEAEREVLQEKEAVREGSTGLVSRREHENRGGAEPEALWEEG